MSESTSAERGPLNHRTVDRVTQILETVTYRPGITFADLARALEAPKSSVHGFVRGLLAKGWLYEESKRFYLGPAIYGLTLASGQMRAGSVTQADLEALHQETGFSVSLGVQAGDHLFYVAVAGDNWQGTFAARHNIRREFLGTAGGKVLLAEKSDAERDSYLRRRGPEEAELVSKFLGEFSEIRRTGIATNFKYDNKQFALAATVRNQFDESVAEITLLGPADEMLPREAELRKALLAQARAPRDQIPTARSAI